jgi:hypothetical protein
VTAEPPIGVALASNALLLADAAARCVLDLRSDSPQSNLHLALFWVDHPPLEAPDPVDRDAVCDYMERMLLADRWLDDPDAVVPALGLTRRQITRLKAFECLHTGVDAYTTIVRRQKYDGATRSYGSHRFRQLLADGGEIELVAAASGWRGDQDYLAAMMVPAALLHVRLRDGDLPATVMTSAGFVLTDGAWEYPAP